MWPKPALSQAFLMSVNKTTAIGASLVVQWLGISIANAGDMGSSPVPGRSHMPWSN